MDPVNVAAKYEVGSLITRSSDNSDCSFGVHGIANPQSWGRYVRLYSGLGTVPFERALLSSYRASIVTFHLSTRFTDRPIAALLRHSIFPKPRLLSPKLPHVPLRIGE